MVAAPALTSPTAESKPVTGLANVAAIRVRTCVGVNAVPHCCFKRATSAATCGVAMEVPFKLQYVVPVEQPEGLKDEETG